MTNKQRGRRKTCKPPRERPQRAPSFTRMNMTTITRADRDAMRTCKASAREVRGLHALLKLQGKRYCRCCDRIKPSTAFNKHHKHGLQYRCRRCSAKRLKAICPPAPVTIEVAKARRAANAKAAYLRFQAAQIVVNHVLTKGS